MKTVESKESIFNKIIIRKIKIHPASRVVFVFELRLSKISVEDSFIDRDELQETLASPFESLKIGTNNHTVFAKVLRDEESITGDYLGFKLYKERDDKTPFYCGKFEKPLIGANVSEDESLHINVMQAVGFPNDHLVKPSSKSLGPMPL